MQPMPGHRVEVFSLDGTDLGPAHVPPPVSIGDVLALVCGPPLKIVSVFHEDEEPGGDLGAAALRDDRQLARDLASASI